jgi:hypothetical protein
MVAPMTRKVVSATQLEKVINSRLSSTGILVSVSRDPDLGWTAEPIIAPRAAAHPQIEVDRIVHDLRKLYSLK